MGENLPIKITETTELEGDRPIVLIGPNGSGKTRYGLKMAVWNNADMIAALRNIALNENVSMQPIQQARNNLQNLHNRRRSRPWELSNEIDHLFSKLMVEDAAAAIRFRDKFFQDKEAAPEKTNLMRLSAIWKHLFPGRRIDFSGYSPRVASDYSDGEATYPAQQMSDGERVALYLAARVLDSEPRIIIVDEPEVHFHSRLAVRFWNELEAMRPDCRFVYITHDLPFALSRIGAQFVIVRPNLPPQPVELERELPRDVIESLLAAASFSIHAQRIVFCEGEEGKSLDYSIYSAWFNDLKTVVIPVGNCRDVAETVVRFANSDLIAGLAAIGIIDRDYWPDTYLDALDKSIYVLPIHEIENLLCLEGIFSAVATHIGKHAESYAEFIKRARAKFQDDLLTYQVSERFKRRVENEFFNAINRLKLQPSMNDTEQHYGKALDPTKWQTPSSTLFSTEKDFVENAIHSTDMDFLKVFPGKVFFNEVKDVLGISRDRYVALVCQALGATETLDHKLYALGKKIEQTMEPILPPRIVTPESSS